jgi:hypothetical protein
MPSPPSPWPALPYDAWHATCDTLHAHTQVLGKLAAALAPPEPQLQHAALRLSARGWETLPLPAPDGSGAIVAALDLRSHHAVVEHTDGRTRRAPLGPDRPVAHVTRDVLDAVSELAGPVPINPTPQETPWTTPLDEDYDHATYNSASVDDYFAAATHAALVLSALRAPYRGRSSPVNAWWGTFDLAVSLYSGETVAPPSNDFIMRNSATAQQIEVGWWPGDARYPPTGVLRVRLSRSGRVRPSDAVTTTRALGHRTRRVPPRLGRRPSHTRSTSRRPRVRPVRDSPRLHRVQLGPSARGKRGGHPTSDYLAPRRPPRSERWTETVKVPITRCAHNTQPRGRRALAPNAGSARRLTATSR